MSSNHFEGKMENNIIRVNRFELNNNSYETKNNSIYNNNDSLEEKGNLNVKPIKIRKIEKKHIISSSSCDNLKVQNIKSNNEIDAKIKRETSQLVIDNYKNKKNSYNILVAVRCRPLNKKEKEISEKETITIIDEKIIKLKDPNGFLNPNNIRAKEKILKYDYAFDSLVGQEQIFNCTTKNLIDDIVNGYNATVFAYGATGAGKTYTMLGEDENPGIMISTLRELYKKILLYQNRDYIIKLWYIEIYNEKIKDLLVNNNDNLELREDPNRGIIINNVTELITNSSEDILNLLKMGNKNRTTEETNANETSSRSHAILQIVVSYKEKNANFNKNSEIKYGKLNLIDLAGSERASVTKNKGIRLIEGANINKSLLTLGNCINALSGKSEKGSKIYVPYRDSKLTRLLKDSLGGNSRTVMIANISPFIYNFDDTYNTLKYAERAKCIKTKVKLNVLEKNQVSNYFDMIQKLKNKINILQNQLNSNNNEDNSKTNIQNSKSNKKTLNKHKRLRSSSPNQIHSDIRKKNNFIDDNFLNMIDTNQKTSIETNNYNTKDENIKKQKYKFRKKSQDATANNKSTNNKDTNNNNNNNVANDFIIDEDLDELLIEKDKKLSLIIEDFIQQSEAEIQLKQKIINIQYNMLLLYNQLKDNLTNNKSKVEGKIKLKNLKKILEKNIETFNDICMRNENFIKKYVDNNDVNDDDEIELNYLQKQYIYTIYKNTKVQKENIEIKFRYTIIKNEYESKIDYIKELEQQVKLRDIIIKELLSLDSLLPNNIKPENNTKYENCSNLVNFLKNNSKYQTLSQIKNKCVGNNKNKNKRKNNSNNEFNRHRSISMNKKINVARKKLFIPSTEANEYNDSNYHEEDYIIDFDKDDSKMSNSNIKIKIPFLTKSNSSFNIYSFDQNVDNSDYLKNIKIKNNPKNKGFILSNCSTDKFLNESNNTYVNRNTEEGINNVSENSNNRIKSMLKEIKNMNNDISSKFSIIEQQSNRNMEGLWLSGQISNKKMKEKAYIAEFLDSEEKHDDLNKRNNSENDNYIQIKENIIDENENENKNNLSKKNISINSQLMNNNFTNRKNKNTINSRINLMKTENKKSGVKIFDCQTSKNTLEKIILSQGKAPNNKESNKSDINKFKQYSNKKNINQNKSNLSTSSQNNINKSNKKMSTERNKSLVNKIPNSNKKENLISNKISNVIINKRIINDDKVPFVDNVTDSQFNLENFKKNTSNSIKSIEKPKQKKCSSNNLHTRLNKDEFNKNNFQNNRGNSFNFKKKSSHEKVQKCD
mgnify:CR=1 FL=1